MIPVVPCGQLDLHPKGDEIQDYLKEITGRLPDPVCCMHLAKITTVLGHWLCWSTLESSSWGTPLCIMLQQLVGCQAMHGLAGGRSVPRVFIGGKFVGGGMSHSSCGTAFTHSHLLQCCGGPARYGCANADACMRLHHVLTFAGDDVVAKLKTGELEKMLKEVGAIKA